MTEPKIKTQWYIDTDDREERKALVLSAQPTLEVLRKIILHKLESKHAERRSKKAYEHPNWPYYQADLVGAERELEELLDLLTIEV